MVFIRDEGVRRELIDHVRIEPAKKYFINVGSVGQPRDGNWRAAYCVYDVENKLVQQQRIKYDLAAAQKKVIDAGLPRMLADRLAMGR
jgi:diadenosine tetraphosphatase ApaH/serine/threonine PP2A family protein phosphatase